MYRVVKILIAKGELSGQFEENSDLKERGDWNVRLDFDRYF